MIAHYFNVEIQPPKNGKPGCLTVTDAWKSLEAVVEVSDTEPIVGQKIAALMTRLEPHG